MAAANTLCLHYAKESLKHARTILEKAGLDNRNDAERLIQMRRQLEMSFDKYLDNRTSDVRKQFDHIVQEIETTYP